MSEQSDQRQPVWEAIYSAGQQLNRYPFDAVVSFIYKNYPRHKPRAETRILEIGSGAGNNLWFAAREGFSTTGIDGSASAVAFAQQRFAQEQLPGEFRVGDFTRLPFPDAQFDFVIDRAALTCSGRQATRQTVAEVRRGLLPGGKFFFNPYSDRHSSYTSGTPGPDGVTSEITGGTLVGIGSIFFYGKRDLMELFAAGWQLRSIRHIETREELEPLVSVHAEWIVVAEKSA
jgi:SAM-dependent methyltransferase